MKKVLQIGMMIFLLLFLLCSCKKDKKDTIGANVNITINLNDTRYIDLNVIGGFIYLTANKPSQGIIVYRKSFEEYKAYERTCTYDPGGVCCRLIVDESHNFAIDTCCGSQFLLIDGSPLEQGPATIALTEYNAHLDGDYLHIYN